MLHKCYIVAILFNMIAKFKLSKLGHLRMRCSLSASKRYAGFFEEPDIRPLYIPRVRRKCLSLYLCALLYGLHNSRKLFILTERYAFRQNRLKSGILFFMYFHFMKFSSSFFSNRLRKNKFIFVSVTDAQILPHILSFTVYMHHMLLNTAYLNKSSNGKNNQCQ